MSDDVIKHDPCQIQGAGRGKAAERRIVTVAQADALANHVDPRQRSRR
ncbi:hypothetical protein AB0D74_03730 [Streptomyces sp. NPDC048278]